MNLVPIIILLYVESEQRISQTSAYKSNQNKFTLPKSNLRGIEARPCDVQRAWGGSSFTSMHTAQRVVHSNNRKKTCKMTAHKRGSDTNALILLTSFYFVYPQKLNLF